MKYSDINVKIIKCPKCGSEKIILNTNSGIKKCAKCDYSWS